MPVADTPPAQRLLLQELEDFSLFRGGPFFRFLRWARLTNDRLRMERGRIAVFAGLSWVPLLILAALEGQAWGGDAAVPFLLDVEAHARFLLALPLLLAAEVIVHKRMRFTVMQFLERNLVPDDALAQYRAAIRSALRLRDSWIAEIVLLVFVYAVGVPVLWHHFVALGAVTWSAAPTPDGLELSLAGSWFAYVSLPLFQFVLCRWYYRLFIWGKFLWQVSRIELGLIPTHPDRVGGLGFLSSTVYSFNLFGTAHGVMLSGTIANRVFYADNQLVDFKLEMAILLVFLLCLVAGPLLVFTAQLSRASRTGAREYGTLAQRYMREFDSKWLRGGAPAGENLLGSSDIQSLADIGNSFEVVRTMNYVPVTRTSLMRFAIACAVPISPLVLTMMSAEELFDRFLRMFF